MECFLSVGVEANKIGLAPRAIGYVAKLDSFVIELNELKSLERNEGVHWSHHRRARPEPGAITENEGVAGASLDLRDNGQGASARTWRGARDCDVAKLVADEGHGVIVKASHNHMAALAGCHVAALIVENFD